MYSVQARNSSLVPAAVAGVGLVGVLAYFALIFFLFFCFGTGLYLGFCASWVVGLVFLLCCFLGVGFPVNVVVGLVYIVAGVDLAAKLATALSL